MNEYGCWHVQKLVACLPNTIVDHILTVVPSSRSESSDVLAWSETSDGIFSLKSAYLHGSSNKIPNPRKVLFQEVWK